jgi:hypothetical protein
MGSLLSDADERSKGPISFEEWGLVKHPAFRGCGDRSHKAGSGPWACTGVPVQ